MKRTELEIGKEYIATEYIGNYCSSLGKAIQFAYFVCGQIFTCESADGYRGYPVFHTSDGKRFYLMNCRGISPLSKVRTGSSKTRAERAEIIRSQIKSKNSNISDMELKINSLREEVLKLDRQATMLEKFSSDEEALAATFSEIMKTNGDQNEILKILKEFGVTNKL